MLEWTPNTFSGSGFTSPATHIVDVAGETLPVATALEIITQQSRSRTVDVTPGDKAAKRSICYKNWLL
jgi:hypothetical protein